MKKRFVTIIMSLALLTSAVSVSAAKFSFDVPQELDIDMSETYAAGEHTMIPLRESAEKLGYDVTWNGDEMSVLVANENVNIKILIGKDSYFINGSAGMTVPATVGAAPELRDNKTYVPAVMINMLKHYNRLSANAPEAEKPTGKITFSVSDSLGIGSSETYTAGEHTMVPLMKAASNKGYSVAYNSDDNSVSITKGNVSAKLYADVDSYLIGVSENPVTLGVAPEIKDGTWYVPAAFFNLFALNLKMA